MGIVGIYKIALTNAKLGLTKEVMGNKVSNQSQLRFTVTLFSLGPLSGPELWDRLRFKAFLTLAVVFLCPHYGISAVYMVTRGGQCSPMMNHVLKACSKHMAARVSHRLTYPDPVLNIVLAG